MGNQIELLIDLQVIDRDLRVRSEAIASLRAGVHEIEARMAEESSALALCDAERTPLDTRRREIEAILADASSKMTERRMRLNRIRTEKEAAAIHREIEVAKEETEELEEELIGDQGLYALLKALNERAAELQEAIDKLQAERDAEHARVEIEASKIADTMGADQARRESVARGLDAALRKRYETIFERRRGLAVVEIEDGACVGCHMSIAPQMANEIRRNESVIACPSCHRILYLKAPEPENQEQA